MVAEAGRVKSTPAARWRNRREDAILNASMFAILATLSSLLLGTGLLLMGNGLGGTLLALRATAEGYSDGTIGLMTSAYFVGFLIGTWIAPSLVFRIGHIRSFAMLAAVASAAFTLHALFVNPVAWSLLRIIVGICLVGLYTVIESWLNTLAPAQHRGRIFAIYMVVNFLCLAAGQSLIQLHSPTGFELFGIASILFAISLVPITATRVDQPARVQQPRVSLRQLYRISPSGFTGALGSGLAMSAFWGLAPVMAQQLGHGASTIAALMIVTILGGAAIQLPIGYWSDRHDRRRVLATVMSAAGVAALLVMSVSASTGPSTALSPMLTLMFVFGGLAFTVYPVSVALVNDVLAPEDMLQGASSMLMVHGIGAAIGPTLAGLLMHGLGPQGLPLHFGSVLLAFSGFVWWRIGHHPRTAHKPVHFEPMMRTSAVALELIVPDAEARADGEIRNAESAFGMQQNSAGRQSRPVDSLPDDPLD